MATFAALARPGREVNPSARGRRAPVVAFGLGGLAVSVAGLVRSAGSSDQLRDVIGFCAVTLTAAIGGGDRWRKRPALVLAFGLAVAMTAASAVVRWSLAYARTETTPLSLLLSTAVAVMLLPLVAEEVYAAGARAYADARASTIASWELVRPCASDAAAYVSGAGGVLLGLWLLVVPATVVGSRAALHAHVAGAVVVVIGALTLSRVARVCRWGNVAIAAWLFVAPLLYGYGARATINAIIVGIPLLVVSVGLADPEESGV